ncbi:MAG TPA: HAD family hydrolase [Gemmatimonas sp.]|uniref:D-glycero-alpha-D-manno-heptose-1,7-bisphosphate 7-phosphatase n=1 Tax=Gemmatimonas sp. TaxID=1962908 RepID=UPI002EDA6307
MSGSDGEPRAALFIDRDGTLIADAHYLADASRVKMLPDAAVAVRRANEAGVPVVIVTNQSGIARGLITQAQYEAVRDRTVALLAAEGATVLATYHCPHPADSPPSCDCRKPGIGLYQQAAREHGLSLSNSGYIGDRWRDVQPAITTGGVGVLVPGIETPAKDVESARSSSEPRVFLADRLLEAVTISLATMGHAHHHGEITRGRSPG